MKELLMSVKKRHFRLAGLVLLVALIFGAATPVFAASVTRFNNPSR
jgi:hypothetical protein